ncbi:CubicO group peptidase (beta-lactamase class C family) [Micromonospora kangleipakensis]|uniref:CubicO group peptidase (Beta-lactamase class C family) n=1 Tax=Micromonospora kangleipakensis TaxID=1077942 RepID=A0A4Q8BCT6_9ACTN|nr:serine hydrolase domain-containing protein [Micromonospora kangleipakensis]RZU75687.1 CubicO group peptidase (beta-lactamase class C family) [Micromonospora kangleipakensis]
MDGRWDGLRAEVRKTIDALVSSGREAGVQVAAYLDGESIVEEQAGLADPATGRPLTADTPVHAVSTGKGLTATVVHVLAERGQLDYDLRIAEVWPEFARHGKDGITLRHALTHTAGVPALPADVTPADFADWERMCALVAAARPRWAPGERVAYHAWTFGWLVGEVVRRATGRRISQVLAEEVAAPLGVTGELFLAVPAADLDRLARLEDAGLAALMEYAGANLPNFDAVAPPAVRPDATTGGNPDVLRADVPAVGTMTARAVTRMYAALLGPVDGVRLISPERLRRVSAAAARGTEWVFGQELAFGLGYAVEDDGSFGTAGSGGSLAFAYPELGLTVAAVRNRLGAGDGAPMEGLRTLIRGAVVAGPA